jgi:hypothetical protein
MTRNKIAKFKSTGRPKQTQVAGQDELGNIECTALLTLSEVKEEIARNKVKNPIPETVKRAHEFVDAEPHKSHVTTGWHSNGRETVAFACLYAQGYFVDFGMTVNRDVYSVAGYQEELANQLEELASMIFRKKFSGDRDQVCQCGACKAGSN